MKLIFPLLAIAFLAACTGGQSLRTEILKHETPAIKADDKNPAKENLRRPVPILSEDVLFTLIYFVGLDKDDKVRAVILDLEDDDIDFIPTVPDFEYEILQNVSIREAIYETEIFFSHERVIIDYYFQKIISPVGRTIGYEIRPVYQQGYYGYEDPIITKYKFNRQRVNIIIKLRLGLRR